MHQQMCENSGYYPAFSFTPRPRPLPKNTAASATSAGSVFLRNGARSATAVKLFERSLIPRADAVFTRPAEIAFTRIFWDAARLPGILPTLRARPSPRPSRCIRQHARRSQIGQRDHRAACAHQRSRWPRHPDHRKRAHFQRQRESRARCVHKRPIQILVKRNRMHHCIQPPQLAQPRQILALRHIALEQARRVKLGRQILDRFFNRSP